MMRDGATAQDGALRSEGRGDSLSGMPAPRNTAVAFRHYPDPHLAELLSRDALDAVFQGVATQPCAAKAVQFAP